MSGQNSKRWLIASALVFAGLAASAGSVWFKLPERKLQSAPTTANLERIHAACVEEMIRSTCKVMGAQRPSPGATSVFVAGVGPVDAGYYRELQASGDAMCSVVRRACEADWNGSQCLTARALYGAVAAKP